MAEREADGAAVTMDPGPSPTVCLSMIVKNEAPVIRRCLDSVRPWITHWAICDTGSTDGTQAIVRDALGDLPGCLSERAWRDFATNRNEALELAEATGAEWILTIDADEELVGVTGRLRPLPLQHDSYSCRFRLDTSPNASWLRRVLLRTACRWRYVGEIHEYLVIGWGDSPSVTLADVEVFSHTDGARGRDGSKAKFRRDADTLRRLLERDPTNARHAYYLAQSLMGAEQFDAAVEAFERRATMGGFEEEVYASLFAGAMMRSARGDHWHDVVQAYLRAYERRPNRAEPLYQVAGLYLANGQPHVAATFARECCRIGRPHDALMVHDDVYAWRCADLMAACLCETGQIEEAERWIARLADCAPAGPDRDRAVTNLATVRADLAKARAA